MAYARVTETGAYIYSDGEKLHLNNLEVPEEYINIFLYDLYINRRNELEERVSNGFLSIQEHKQKLGDINDTI